MIFIAFRNFIHYDFAVNSHLQMLFAYDNYYIFFFFFTLKKKKRKKSQIDVIIEN